MPTRKPSHVGDVSLTTNQEIRSNSSPSQLATNIASVPRRRDNDCPLWQGPCAAGPLGGITQSMLVRFLSCRERFRLKYILGLEPPDRWNHKIGYGNMWHVCEEGLAADVDPLLKLKMYCTDLVRKYPLQREEITKWWNVCLVQFPEYVEYWTEHPDVKNRTPLMQEQVFDVAYNLPSGRIVRLRGKFDSVDAIRDERTGPNGGIYLQENKTKGDIDQSRIERQLKFDLQTMVYLVALQKNQQNMPTRVYQPDDNGPLIPILGVRYNVVRRPLSGGKGNITPHKVRSTKTKIVPAETDNEFYERLRRDYIADDPAYWFFRVRAEISVKDIEVFRQTCLDPLLETVCDWYDYICIKDPDEPTGYATAAGLNYRTPFGVWSALEEGGATEYDAYLATGSELGLRRVETMFTELQ